ncbi:MULTISPECIES: response regulator [Ralstonia]|jgi:two-component system, NarL family, nitrate/nitrite response regulator NarL|uniref:Oxygen regulatory protein NreC n=3 Tax=Pseudomonadota TaxID=1224 RepID=A0ABM9INU8_RALPI|nr:MULTISPECIES: response regulator transcription factor [Ralstonia]MBA4201611.1 two-component system response regulator NarL [Ralstonia sp.]MBA4231657.1 two-component system response regulator NarL [Ralstonia sp.]MBA4238275.1 two-component system response regulator NarL [Ralstonia sp.]MBA4279959.1 two-component system response regulator NarL [Ralstonia sp.]MBA4295664.1 two-component system response regulator NarL [Ralstonia sp.]
MNMHSPMPVKLLLVDDHPLVRDGVRVRLEAVPHFEVVGEAGDAEAALEAARTLAPDLALMDIGMRGMNGIALTEKFAEEFPEIAVLVLSMHDNLEYVRQVIRAGARGYVLKDAPASELVEAIDAVLAGRPFYSAQLAMRMAEQAVMPTPVEALTPRERDILDGIAKGYANKRIADELGLSVRTVESHRLNLKRKLGIEGQAELVKFAVELGKGR